MDNKLNNMIEEFMKNTKAKDMDELNAELQKFIMKYNNGEIEYENTPLDDAYELLEEADNAKTKKEAIKLAKKAYELCPACFDALLYQANLEDNSLKRLKLINDGLKTEEARLKEEDFFDKECIGKFYGIYETRPYIRGLYRKALELATEGKIKLAIEVCKESLKLCENDNTGIRYLLMALYAITEDEKPMITLMKKYEEDNLEMLFPMLAIYYKKENDKKAKEYLARINKANSNFLKYYKGTIKPEENALEGCYTKGGASEVLMYNEVYGFLVETLPFIDDFIIEYSKEK